MMTPKRIQWLCAFLSIVGASIYLYAQNPVSISQVGTTPVTTTVPVSGTVAATQSGTWTVQPGNTANTTAWKVDGSAVTQPVSGTVTAAQATAANLNATVVGTGTFATQAAQSGTWTVQPGNTANTTPWLVTGSGTAGTAAAGVLTVQGIASMTKLLVTPDSVALPANQSVNVAQMNGVTTTMGAGATGTGVQRVNDVASAATGAAPPASALYIGGLQSGATGGFLGGIAVADTFKGVNVSTATTTLMVTGVSGRQVRVSSFHLVTAAANNVQWISGTGATCGTGTTGIGGGGTTAASGYNFAANGGIAAGNGLGQVFTTTATGDSLCLVTSAATQLSGIIAYSIY